jgi:hypothetical protein
MIAMLERTYAVITHPTGLHLIAAIADLIEGEQTSQRPELIVVDRWACGCAGTTISAGLRELGITIPVVLVDESSREWEPPVRLSRLAEASSA